MDFQRRNKAIKVLEENTGKKIYKPTVRKNFEIQQFSTIKEKMNN